MSTDTTTIAATPSPPPCTTGRTPIFATAGSLRASPPRMLRRKRVSTRSSGSAVVCTSAGCTNASPPRRTARSGTGRPCGEDVTGAAGSAPSPARVQHDAARFTASLAVPPPSATAGRDRAHPPTGVAGLPTSQVGGPRRNGGGVAEDQTGQRDALGGLACVQMRGRRIVVAADHYQETCSAVLPNGGNLLGDPCAPPASAMLRSQARSVSAAERTPFRTARGTGPGPNMRLAPAVPWPARPRRAPVPPESGRRRTRHAAPRAPSAAIDREAAPSPGSSRLPRPRGACSAAPSPPRS